MVYTRTIAVRASKAEVLRVLRGLGGVVSGAPFTRGAESQRFKARIGLTVQDFLYHAFRQKSDGAADATGLRWPPLAPLTIRLKRRTAPANATKVLREFDDLERSLKPALRPEDAQANVPQVPWQVFRIEPRSIVLGTSRKWAEVHHRGSGRIPERRLWPKPSTWVTTWWSSILHQAQRGLMDLIASLLSSTP